MLRAPVPTHSHLTLCSHPYHPLTSHPHLTSLLPHLTLTPHPTSPSPLTPPHPHPSPHLNPYPLQPPVGSLTGVDGYRVAVAPPLPNGQVLLDLPLTQTTLVLTDLGYFTEYTFQVAVYSLLGNGPFTEPVSARTGEGGGCWGEAG